MMLKKTTILIVISLIVVFFFILPAINKAGWSNLLPPQIQSNEVKCNVHLSNPSFSKVQVDSVNCQKINFCIKSFSFSSWIGLSDTGSVIFKTTDNQDSKKYDIGEFGNRDFVLEMCTNTNQGIVGTIATNGDITSLKDVSW